MRSYLRILSGLLVAMVAVLIGCANDENPGPVHAKDLATQKGEVLVPYEPAVSLKIMQDPNQFPMPAVAPPVETSPVPPAEAPAAAPAEETPGEAPETPAVAPAEPSASGGGSGPSGLEPLPPTAPAPVGLGN